MFELPKKLTKIISDVMSIIQDGKQQTKRKHHY